ncbi:MAG: putative O-acetyltransferase [Acidimicrobiales bacterium]|nr:putative O-acetyltransferase [Acidimicrobiales bacterium]
MADQLPTAGPPRPEPLGYQPALDGVRAVAIGAVLLFHIEPHPGRPALHGGFLGVDVFFVLSGFLITSLVLDERAATGHVRLSAFWGRRVARLIPLLLALLGLALVVRQTGWPSSIRPPSPLGFLAVLGYVGNWVPSAHHRSLGSFQYVWSLGIEEQFYVVWPIVLAAVLASGRLITRTDEGRRRAVVALVAIAGAAVAAGWRAVFWRDVMTWNQHNVYMVAAVGEHRVRGWDTWYFHTGLRADGLLIGAALAASRHLWQPRLRRGGATLVAVAGGAVGTWILLTSHIRQNRLPYWGLLALELSVAALTAGLVAERRSRASRTLAVAPLVWLGRRSYAAYLLHLPIILVVDRRLHGQSPAVRAVVALVVVLASAHLAHVLVELPAQRRLRRVLHAEHVAADPAPAAIQG